MTPVLVSQTKVLRVQSLPPASGTHLYERVRKDGDQTHDLLPISLCPPRPRISQQHLQPMLGPLECRPAHWRWLRINIVRRGSGRGRGCGQRTPRRSLGLCCRRCGRRARLGVELDTRRGPQAHDGGRKVCSFKSFSRGEGEGRGEGMRGPVYLSAGAGCL